MNLSPRTAARIALTAGRSMTLAGVAAFWVGFGVYLFPAARNDVTSAVAGWGLSLAAWSCVSLLVLCLAVFPDERSGLDGAVGLVAAVPGSLHLLVPPEVATLGSWLTYASTGVLLTLCGIFLAVVTLRPRPNIGGVDAHPQV